MNKNEVSPSVSSQNEKYNYYAHNAGCIFMKKAGHGKGIKSTDN